MENSPQLHSSLPSEQFQIPLHRKEEETHCPLLHRNWLKLQPKYSISLTRVNDHAWNYKWRYKLVSISCIISISAVELVCNCGEPNCMSLILVELHSTLVCVSLHACLLGQTSGPPTANLKQVDLNILQTLNIHMQSVSQEWGKSGLLPICSDNLKETGSEVEACMAT